MQSRRTFLKTAALCALAPAPAFLARTARAAPPGPDARLLVVIQLDGGNDGINTVIPYKDEGYAKHRKTLRISEPQLLKFQDVGLHPSLARMRALVRSNWSMSASRGLSLSNARRNPGRMATCQRTPALASGRLSTP